MYERRRTAPPRDAVTAQRSTRRCGRKDSKRENQYANNNPLDSTGGPDLRGGRVCAGGFVRTEKFGRNWRRRWRSDTGPGRSSPATRRRCAQREKPERSERSAEQGKPRSRSQDQEHLPRLLERVLKSDM